MNKDLLKTVLGLVIVVLIIITAFIFGSEQNKKQAQNTKTAPSKTKVVVNPPRSIAQPKPSPKVVVVVPTPSVRSNTTNGSMPQTGASDTAFIPLSLMALAIVGFYRSKNKLAFALRNK